MEHLSKIDYFQQLSINQKLQLTKFLEIKQFQRQQIVYREGSQFENQFYLIIEGEFQLMKINERKNINLIILHQNDLIGEIEILSKSPRKYSIECISQTGKLLAIKTDKIILEFITQNFYQLHQKKVNKKLLIYQQLYENTIKNIKNQKFQAEDYKIQFDKQNQSLGLNIYIKIFHMNLIKDLVQQKIICFILIKTIIVKMFILLKESKIQWIQFLIIESKFYKKRKMKNEKSQRIENFVKRLESYQQEKGMSRINQSKVIINNKKPDSRNQFTIELQNQLKRKIFLGSQ